MTEKLYEQDSMLKSCLATVLSCAEDKRGYAVVLDRTVSFRSGRVGVSVTVDRRNGVGGVGRVVLLASMDDGRRTTVRKVR